MIRAWTLVLGFGLVLLWIAGLGNVNAQPWLTWLDGVAAIGSFVISGMSRPTPSMRYGRIGATYLLSLGLFGLWIIGLATGAVRWLSWWNFAFACAYMIVAIGGSSMQRRARSFPPSQEPPKEAPRKAA